MKVLIIGHRDVSLPLLARTQLMVDNLIASGFEVERVNLNDLTNWHIKLNDRIIFDEVSTFKPKVDKLTPEQKGKLPKGPRDKWGKLK